jgi:hypothetical protein
VKREISSGKSESLMLGPGAVQNQSRGINEAARGQQEEKEALTRGLEEEHKA